MKTVTLPADASAAQVRFGVELETYIPNTAGVAVGAYHRGSSVGSGISTADGSAIVAPVFRRTHWRAERDASIRPDAGHAPSEFVSPILVGDDGVEKLMEFVRFLNQIGAKVNASCGCHVTVSIPSVIGTHEFSEVAAFVRKLAILVNHNAWAIYAQTGTDRHQNGYSAPLNGAVAGIIEQMQQTTDPQALIRLANQCGRGIVNFMKAFNGENACVEFRAFAGTLNEAKLLHHVATAIGLMRFAHVRQVVGAFTKSPKKFKATTAPEALRRMWRSLGWSDANEGRTCALGLFGPLHAEFFSYRKTALQMADQFQTRFPEPNL